MSKETNITEHHEVVATSDAAHNSNDNGISAWRCIKENPKIILYTLYANIGALMIGYDNLTLSVCLAMPAFQCVFLV